MDQMRQLWEYQQKDMALDRFDEEQKNTPTRKRLVKLQRYLKNSQKKVNSLEARALQLQGEMQSVVKQYGVLEGDLDELEKDIGYYSECADEELDAQQVKEVMRQATALVEQSEKLKESLQAMQQEVDQSDKTVRELLQKMLSAKKEYDALKVEARAAAEGISPEILEEYARIKGFRPNPVAILKESRCNGCNMQLPAGVAVQITKGDHLVTCENCGRILITMA